MHAPEPEDIRRGIDLNEVEGGPLFHNKISGHTVT